MAAVAAVVTLVLVMPGAAPTRGEKTAWAAAAAACSAAAASLAVALVVPEDVF